MTNDQWERRIAAVEATNVQLMRQSRAVGLAVVFVLLLLLAAMWWPR